MSEKKKISSEVLTNSRTRSAIERVSGKNLPPTVDEQVDNGNMSIGEALERLDQNETRSWVMCWKYTGRDDFQPVCDSRGGH